MRKRCPCYGLIKTRLLGSAFNAQEMSVKKGGSAKRQKEINVCTYTSANDTIDFAGDFE